MSLSPTHDPESLYYLDPDFRPENKLSMVILRGAEDNYFIWKRDVFESRNKTGFVDGTLVRSDPSSPLYNAWKQCNEMVACWLLNSELSEYDPVPECLCEDCRCEISKRAKETRDDEKAFGFLIGLNNDVNITHSLVYALNVDWKIHQLREMTAMPMQGGRSLAVYFQELDMLGRS
ncbi:hypothetical protein HID58_065525 [Brassica napus]|uniref:Retrotransposon Copia-like N-terminal domain-containing protein n=1 Tax=Brassica napus TaxID=3708 RepID=A0ABQ7ZD23_BRANA|nr:hypothetical protein HID58_065525 [Brassica napus]